MRPSRGARKLAAPASAARSEAGVGELEGLDLEGQRHVGARAALREESSRGARELAKRHQHRLVGEALALGAREERMDRGREAVRNRVADDGVAIHRVAGGIGGKGRVPGGHDNGPRPRPRPFI
jgi:hypothetical protein